MSESLVILLRTYRKRWSYDDNRERGGRKLGERKQKEKENEETYKRERKGIKRRKNKGKKKSEEIYNTIKS